MKPNFYDEWANELEVDRALVKEICLCVLYSGNRVETIERLKEHVFAIVYVIKQFRSN